WTVDDAVRDVVKSGSAFSDLFRDRRLRSGRLEQFEPRLADRREVRAHLLRLDVLGALDVEAERVAIEGERGRQVLDCDADVIERGFHGHLGGSLARPKRSWPTALP